MLLKIKYPTLFIALLAVLFSAASCTPSKKVVYLNSGDWVENCTALEYSNSEWVLYKHPVSSGKKKNVSHNFENSFQINIPNTQALYEDIVFDSGYR